MSYLLDFYGEAIPEKHREIMSQYYEEDLSLSEIAENFGISRQGARHLIKKGEEQLIFLEEKLGLAKRHKDAIAAYERFDHCMQGLRMALISSDKSNDKDKLIELLDAALLHSQQLKLD